MHFLKHALRRDIFVALDVLSDIALITILMQDNNIILEYSYLLVRLLCRNEDV